MASTPAVQPSAPIEKKLKKQEQYTDTRPDSIQKEKRKKKKPHDDPSVSEVGAEPTQVMESSDRPTKKQKKNVRETITPEDQQSPGLEGASPKKPKREKRPKKPKDKSKGRKEEALSATEKIQIADVPIPYINPLTDETLPDTTQRGLVYTYQYVQHISLTSEFERAEKHAWKFNKARQNWVLRNITDPAVIPDSYLPISLIYVASIQGGARDELRKTCTIIKKQAKASKALSSNGHDESGPKAELSESPVITSESPKKVTFAAGTTDPAEPAIVEPETPAPSKVKVKRAKTILKVLKGKINPQDI